MENDINKLSNVIMDPLVETELEEGEIKDLEKGPDVIMDPLVETELEEGEIEDSEKGPNVIMDPLVETELEEGEIEDLEKGPNVIMDPLVETELEEGEIEDSEKGPNVIMDPLVETELEEGEIEDSEKGPDVIMDPLVETELEEGEIEDSEKGPNVIVDPLVETELEEGEIEDLEKGPNVIMDPLVETELEEGEIEDSEKGPNVIMDPLVETELEEGEIEDLEKGPNVIMEPLVETELEEGEIEDLEKGADDDVEVLEGVNSLIGKEKKTVMQIDGLQGGVAEQGAVKSSMQHYCQKNVYPQEGVEVIQDLKKRPADDADGLGYKMKDKVHTGCQTTTAKNQRSEGKDINSKKKRHRPSPEPQESRNRKLSWGEKSLQGNEYNHIADSEEQNDGSEGLSISRVALPPFGPKNLTDDRNRVRETLQLFQTAFRKLLQSEEAKKGPGKDLISQKPKSIVGIIFAAKKYIKRLGKEVNNSMKIIGQVPGVEVGDEFQYRAELAIVGVHRPYRAGIDYTKYEGDINVAVSIVASGGYDNESDNPDVLIYYGHGGNVGVADKNKPAEDQKLKRGNLALKNCINTKTDVRVIHGYKESKSSESLNAKGKRVMSYVYDGLYRVVDYEEARGRDDKLVFKFVLKRNPDQSGLSWKEVNKVKTSKTREGLCVEDISGAKESIPICAVNTIDNEKPPRFNYIKKMAYPTRNRPALPKGCKCKRCWDFEKCTCAYKNGGEVPVSPYMHNGAIVETRTLVYECGPSCKCPLSCYNRVTQHGIKIPLEIFKTKFKGWGVRSQEFIPSGTFICEYIGEILEDGEAKKRVGFDEYLFDIGQNYKDCSPDPDPDHEKHVEVENSGFCIDAFKYGNVGRFINHSCSPNLYAQNVLYDHDDKRMPHIMFFAAENIPPLQELTYHYNCAAVLDVNGNMKNKSCYCGSTQCTGKLY